MRLAELVLVVVVALAPAAPAGAEPSNRNLVWAGVGMSPVGYFTGVIAHEGSHAVAAKLLGLEITDMRLLPGRHPRTNKFYFAWVGVRGIETKGQRAWFLVAPKITDAIALGTYAVFEETGTLPDNRYGRLALAVLATVFWVDFSRDVFAWWDHNDTVRIYHQYGLVGAQQLPYRAGHAGLAAAAAYPIIRGYQGAFEDQPSGATPLLLPLLSGTF